MKELLARATEGARVRERKETSELKASLKQAMDELSITKSRLQEVEADATSSQLETSIKYHESTAVKADFLSLTESLKKTKEQHADEISGLQKKIDELVSTRANIDNAYCEEVAAFKNRLLEAEVERGQLQSVHDELEKKYSLLKEIEDNNGSSHSEASKVRMQYSELLAKYSEETSSTERRVREAMATSTAASEAELILQRELRISAEGAIEELQRQLDEVRQELDEAKHENHNQVMSQKNGGHNVPEELDMLRIQVKNVERRCEDMAFENRELLSKIDVTKHRCDELYDSATKAKLEVREALEARHSAEVALEMLKSNGAFLFFLPYYMDHHISNFNLTHYLSFLGGSESPEQRISTKFQLSPAERVHDQVEVSDQISLP